MSSVWDRIAIVVQTKLVENENQWLEKAGLSRGYFGSRRNEQAEKGRPVGFSTATLKKLADAAGVNFTWLATGVGPIRDNEMSQVKDSASGPAYGPDMLVAKIAELEPAELRKALGAFYAVHRDKEAISTCEQFITQAYKRGELDKTREHWTREIMTAYKARKELWGQPFSAGALKI